MTLLILADDLTGAADCAARCHHAGLATGIYPHRAPAGLADDAICLTSDSRQLDAELAAERVRELAEDLRAYADCSWYKKIDSTLRGHIGAELDALLEALGRTCAVVCPAFPAQQRGLHNGYLITTPTRTQPLHLPTLLAQQSRRQVAALNLDDVRAGIGHLADRMADARAAGAELLVVDALTDADVQTVLDATLQALPTALLCGSAGLAGTLAAHLAQQLPERESKDHVRITATPALLVIGSGSAMAHRQIAHLRSHPTVAALQAGADIVLAAAGDLLFHLPAPAPNATLDGPAARQLAEQLAAEALPLIERLQPALLVLAGGDTAICLLDRLGITQLKVERELLPGIPLTRAVDASGRSYAIILKAGNHGDEMALATLLASVR